MGGIKLFFLLLCFLFASSWAQQALNVENRIAFIPIKEIDTGVSAYVKRAIRSAVSEKASVVVFEIDIRDSANVLAAIEIAGLIQELNSREDKIKTVAWVKQSAQSLGAFIVFSCKEIYMVENSEIGLGMAGVSYASSPNFVKAFSNEISNLAIANNHHPDIATAMVDPEVELKEIRVGGKTAIVTLAQARQMQEDPSIGEVVEISTVVAKGELLNFSATQAEKFSLSKTTTADETSLSKAMGIPKIKIRRYEISWSERLVSWLTTWYISALLLAVGFIGLWIEFKAPGFGVFGIVGIIALTLLFVSKYMAGLAQVYEIVLIFVGIILLAIEFFVFPGTWIFGIIGTICFGTGMILSFQNYVFPNPSKPWEVNDFVNNISSVLASLSITVIGLLGMLQYLQHNKTFQNRFVITATSPDGGLHNAQVSNFASLLGQHGICVTELRPAGKIEIGEKFYDVVSTGDFISRGENIKIVDISSNRIMVEKIED